jgi:hypothetical protein
MFLSPDPKRISGYARAHGLLPAGQRAGARGSAGLVSFKQVTRQSGKPSTGAASQPVDRVEIDLTEARLKRMKYSTLTATRLLSEQAQDGGMRGRWAMLTMTYAELGKWQPRHVSDLLKHVRHWMQRRGHDVRFVWVAEMQKRGAVHYHVLVWLPRGLTLPKPDKQGWWPHGSTRIEWARCAGGYLAKYVSKGDTTPFPIGARIHGAGGLTGLHLAGWRWWKRPRYVRERIPDASTPVRRVRGGWVNLETGEFMESEWRYAGIVRGKVILVRKSAPTYIPAGI